jgi:glycosyltransferase involved in cell wall biosynthesis
MLANRIRGFVVSRLDALAAAHLPGLRLPSVFGGHQVGADTRADLAWTLGLLRDGGVTSVAGLPTDDALRAVLRETDGERTETFGSYRLAETVARYGRFDGNPLLAPLTAAEQAQIEAGTDSRHILDKLTAGLSPNYYPVLARCEAARQRLGLPVDQELLDDLIARTRTLLASGYLDDSAERRGHFDIYTVDSYLFTDTLAGRLGEVWRSGAVKALDLAESVCTRNGAAIGWGRSTGALSVCLTIELAGLVARHGLADGERAAAWAGRAARAFELVQDWFSGSGLITAHQYRSTYAYRGPHRRLQMTLDCLGKLADAANALDGVPDAPYPAPTARDEVVWFDQARHAGVWSYRSPDLAFVLPMVGSGVTDYLAAPRNPGLFEVPVDSGLATGVPVAFSGGARFAPCELPAHAVKVPAGLELAHDGWYQATARDTRRDREPLGGRRHASYRVDGRTLRVSEDLTFDTPPDALALQVAETAGRPLRVEFDVRDGDQVTTIDTSGLAEYRSFWAELTAVHQVDLRPGTRVRFGWSVTPLLRVMSREYGHHYDASLYAPLAGRVAESALPPAALDGDQAAQAALADCDIFHLHWPESMLPPDLARHQAFIDALRASEVRIVWTQHNLIPHQRDPRWDAIYRVWAGTADAVIHHSAWGQSRALARYRYAAHTRHVVIPHGHFGNLMTELAGFDRAAAEASLGLRPGVLRLGIVGAPRAEKRADIAMAAVAASTRDDIELLVCTDRPAPADPRIVRLPPERVSRAEYNRRLAVLDALVLPFDNGEMLTTGAVGDAVGAGLPSLVSDWPYLAEALGDAGIRYGSSAADLAHCIDTLDEGRLGAAAKAAVRLQEDYDWRRVADLHFELLERVGTAKLLVTQPPWAKAASKDAGGGSICASFRTNASASGAPASRSIPASSHSTEIGPS